MLLLYLYSTYFNYCYLLKTYDKPRLYWIFKIWNAYSFLIVQFKEYKNVRGRREGTVKKSKVNIVFVNYFEDISMQVY